MAGDWETSAPHIVIESVAEKSLSFAVRRSMLGTPKRETCSPQTFGHRPFIKNRREAPHLFSLPRMGKGDRDSGG